jgi:hypothetical protein
MNQAAEETVDVAALGKLHIDRSGVAENHDKHRHFVDLTLRVHVFTDPPVYLGLFPRAGFIPLNCRELFGRTEILDIVFKNSSTALVALLTEKPEKDFAVVDALIHVLVQKRLEGIQLGWPFSPGLPLRKPLCTKIPPDGIAGMSRFSRNRPNTLANRLQFV